MSVTAGSRIELTAIDQAIESLSKDHFAYTTRGAKQGALICPFCSELAEGVIAEWPCHVAQLAMAHEALARVVRAALVWDSKLDGHTAFRRAYDEFHDSLAPFRPVSP